MTPARSPTRLASWLLARFYRGHSSQATEFRAIAARSTMQAIRQKVEPACDAE
jgi:hypothetical protein